MAQDMKYGHVTLENGTVPDIEPVIVFRAQDALLPELMAEYIKLCIRHGSPRHHIDLCVTRLEQIRDWQKNHRVQIPRSDSYAQRSGLAG
jgi:hypothetical protein